MRNMFAKLRLPSSSACTLGLVMLGFLPAIRGPFPSFSLDTTRGTYLYVGAVILLGLGYLLAEKRETVARKTEQEERDALWRREQEVRDALSEKRHLADLAATDEIKALSTKMLAAMAERTALAAQGIPSDNPKMQELAETVRVSAATIGGIVSFPAGGIFKTERRSGSYDGL